MLRAPRGWPGALLATIALAGLGLLLYLAIAGFGSTSSVYGIAASTVSALISAYTAIYLILLGAVVNAQWEAEAGPRSTGGDEDTSETSDRVTGQPGPERFVRQRIVRCPSPPPPPPPAVGVGATPSARSATARGGPILPARAFG